MAGAVRSPASAEHPTNIAVYFGGVDALALPESFDGLHVRKADPASPTRQITFGPR